MLLQIVCGEEQIMRVRVRLLAGVAAFALSAGGALAADLPRRAAPPPAAYVAVPVFTWTGFYIGANAGYGFHNNNDDVLVTDNTLFVPQTPTTAVAIGGFSSVGVSNRNRDGFVGGGQIGYNYQFGSWVIGIEADAQFTDFGRSRNNGGFGVFGADSSGFATVTPTVSAAAGASVAGAGFGVAPGSPNIALFNNGAFSGRRNHDWFGTVRGRLGWAWERLLIYGTGGLAFTDSNDDRAFGTFGSGAAVPLTFYTSPTAAARGAGVSGGTFSRRTDDNIGYAVGGGLEYAFTPNLSGKIEGLYVNFGNGGRTIAGNSVVGVSNTGAPITAASASFRNRDDDFAVVRAGLNWKLNWF